MRVALRRRTRIAACLGVIAAWLAMAPPAGASPGVEAKPFGTLDCVPAEGVRFCEGSVATRVPSFDGVPLDVNVTLPADGSRRLPLIIQLHGWGGRKSGLGSSREWAEDGYAVLNYTARGFGDSCGSAASRAADPEGCAKGWIHLADSRYEARDSQYLAGLLADQRLIHPRRIGVMGGSYGGGQSLELATLRDRTRLPSGEYVRWRSPGRRLGMSIAAAVPTIPWSDLVYSLMPNGGTLDGRVTDDDDDLFPVGIKKDSYVNTLFAAGAALGFYAPPGADPGADLVSWINRINLGEPYDSDPYVRSVVEEIARNHSAYYLDMSREPAPTLISNGFTDDLFPADEAVRWANRVLAEHRHADVSQLHFDYGHPRGQGKPDDMALLRRRTHEWFDYYVKRERQVPVLRGVEALTQTCPPSAPSGGPFQAPTWDELSPGDVRYSAPAGQAVLSTSGNPAVSAAIDPIGGGGACATTPAADEPGTATYRLPAAAGSGYTLLGSPTIEARLEVSGQDPTLALRLWDVAPDGLTGDPGLARAARSPSQTLVARGLLRPRGNGRHVFQLHPNGWHFAAGHVPKLELVGRDVAYARPSNFPWSIEVSDLELTLPVREP